MRAPRLPLALLLLSLVLSCRPAATGPAPSSTPRTLDPAVAGWLPENRARLDAFLRGVGVGSPGYDPTHRPVATFDWDNTMMRNDIGDATMTWMLQHDAILQPPGRDWAVTSGALTDLARAALRAACDAAGEPGRPLATRETAACADAILSIYASGRTPSGATAWTREITLTTNEAYAWLAHLLAGHTREEVAAFARAAYDANARAPIGATETVGTHAGVTAWVRIYEPMRDLVGALTADGFDVWIISASPQNVTEVVAGEVGVAPDHVVGVRSQVGADGRLGYRLEPCGGAPADSVITFDQGKRCFINKVVFHAPEARQLAKADAGERQAFAAGDSDTDVAFVQDATRLKLTIDRHRVGLMCNAYSNAGGRWLVQPMFIEPLPPRVEPYACATARDAAGRVLVDEDGQPMRDQSAAGPPPPAAPPAAPPAGAPLAELCGATACPTLAEKVREASSPQACKNAQGGAPNQRSSCGDATVVSEDSPLVGTVFYFDAGGRLTGARVSAHEYGKTKDFGVLPSCGVPAHTEALCP